MKRREKDRGGAFLTDRVPCNVSFTIIQGLLWQRKVIAATFETVAMDQNRENRLRKPLVRQVNRR